MNNAEKLFAPSHIIFNHEVETKEECLKELSYQAQVLGIASDKEKILAGFFVREEECTTGFGGGLAIPHTKCEAVLHPGILFFKSRKGMDWQAFDDKPVYAAIALLVPASNEGNLHLSLLSSLSRKLINKEFKEKLLYAENKETVYEIIIDAIKED